MKYGATSSIGASGISALSKWQECGLMLRSLRVPENKQYDPIKLNGSAKFGDTSFFTFHAARS